MKKGFQGGLWFFVILFFLASVFLEKITPVDTELTYDGDMRTERFQTDVVVGEDNSYTVTETIAVDFLNHKHGIYRYIPIKGFSEVYLKDGKGKETKKTPYYGDVEVISASAPLHKDKENGYFVMRLGSENKTVYGEQVYKLSYKFTPSFQKKGYTQMYYNVLPITWQNNLPAGSGFSITFPKDFNHNKLKIFYGAYGSTAEGRDILETSWSGNTLKGVLTRELAYGNGVTLSGDMGDGYFTQTHLIPRIDILLTVFSAVMILVTGILFVFFGRDEKIIPSIQFQPPSGLDSAAVGYIIDGCVQDKDVLSLIIYWADKGYLKIEEPKKGKLYFIKLSELPLDAPQYAKVVFARIFHDEDKVSLSSLKYHFSNTIAVAKTSVKAFVENLGGLYTTSSKIARVVSSVLCVLPMAMFLVLLGNYSKLSVLRVLFYAVTLILLLVGICLFNYVVDNWYTGQSGSRKGQAVTGVGLTLAACAGFAGSYFTQLRTQEVFDLSIPLIITVVGTALMVLLTGFMKKRTDQCVDWMGRLAGLRDFIETAELDRLKVMAQENPQWFYHILPYTYVFGLSDVFAKKLEGLALPAPQWYAGYDMNYRTMNFYGFHHSFMRNMTVMSTALTISEPVKVSGASGGSGGGFTGGFSGGGGGFSGGGFGGGGGGSW